LKNLVLSQNGQSLPNKMPSQSISVELGIFKKLQSYKNGKNKKRKKFSSYTEAIADSLEENKRTA